MAEYRPPERGLPPLNPPRKKKRGFAAMDPEKRREIARKGGAAVPPHMRSFSQNRELASEAGHKGGKKAHALGKAHKWSDGPTRTRSEPAEARARRLREAADDD